jgi:preprotein translocase subunit SecG
METVIIVIHLMVVLAMVGVVLLQRSEGGALGIGGGGGGFMSVRGAANALTRTTAILAAAFFATSIMLGVIAKINEGPNAILERIPTQSEQGTGEGILDQITPPGADSANPGAENGQPAAPQVPSDQ